jgi:hypothetical protein
MQGASYSTTHYSISSIHLLLLSQLEIFFSLSWSETPLIYVLLLGWENKFHTRKKIAKVQSVVDRTHTVSTSRLRALAFLMLPAEQNGFVKYINIVHTKTEKMSALQPSIHSYYY